MLSCQAVWETCGRANCLSVFFSLSLRCNRAYTALLLSSTFNFTIMAAIGLASVVTVASASGFRSAGASLSSLRCLHPGLIGRQLAPMGRKSMRGVHTFGHPSSGGPLIDPSEHHDGAMSAAAVRSFSTTTKSRAQLAGERARAFALANPAPLLATDLYGEAFGDNVPF